MSDQQETGQPDPPSGRTAEAEEELSLRRHCLGLAVFLWAFPLCVSWVLFVVSFGDFEMLGFWCVLHGGPLLSVFTRNASNSQLLISTIIFDVVFLVSVLMIYRSQALRLGVPFLLALLGWYLWAGYDFVKHLHFA